MQQRNLTVTMQSAVDLYSVTTLPGTERHQAIARLTFICLLSIMEEITAMTSSLCCNTVSIVELTAFPIFVVVYLFIVG